ncbi:MAG: glycosyl transferase family 2 [Sphingomonas bacterium]|nr:glycosyl transferase family 2 [Sphingomonas bacterium]
MNQPDVAPFVSVVVCTRNRAEQLTQFLRTAEALSIPEGVAWEIVAVDNGSTDETATVIKSFDDTLPIRYVHEPEAGLSNARNRGVMHARGTYICWTDDDVELDPFWLAAYVSSFRMNPTAAFFGGVVEPVLLGSPPSWLVENRSKLSDVLAERDFGSHQRPLPGAGDFLPYGANFAVRTEEQRRHLFDPNLGVGPNRNRLGEETAVLNAIVDAGGTGMWVPAAIVKHMISPDRQTLAYVAKYQRAAGETWAYLNLREPETSQIASPSEYPCKIPLWLWRRAISHRFRYFLYRRTRASGKWLECWLHYNFFKGAILYMVRSNPLLGGR